MIEEDGNYIGTTCHLSNGYKLAVNKQLEDGETHVWFTLWDAVGKKTQYDLIGDDKDVAKFALEIVKVLKKELL